jgi:predicted anti-sigma-YlaC factor YlaD
MRALVITCKEASTLVSAGTVPKQPLARRAAVWLHLAMCRQCRAFRRQVAAVARAAQAVSLRFEAELSSDFETSIRERLRK